MVSPSLQSLLDLCGISIAYLMWTRQDLKQYPKAPSNQVETLFDQLVDVVMADVQKLPLPKKLKSRILPIVKPAGQRVLRLLQLWLTKTLPRSYLQWHTAELLHGCLVLNGDGQINERKTAEKMLSSEKITRYPATYAFRLACVNFLEKEVLKLWIFVKEWFLHKISTEDYDISWLQALCPFPSRDIFVKTPDIVSGCKYVYCSISPYLSSFTSTREPDEVLFWISYCLARENATSIKEVPHFIGDNVDWYEFALESAAYSGSAACLDYFINICKKDVDYCYAGMIIGKFFVDESNYDQTCFISHFMLLDSHERAELIRKYPHEMVFHFLQWPLSQTFVEKAEEIWKIIPDEYKDWVFLKIFAMIFRENPLLNPISEIIGFRRLTFDCKNVTYNVEHLRRIWIALWEISLDCFKMTVLNSIVFKSITHSRRFPEFRIRFEDCGLKSKLLQLFLSNGKAVSELYDGKTIKRSLINLVAEYMPKDFGCLYRECISFLKREDKCYREKVKHERKEKVRLQRYKLISYTNYQWKPIHGDFLNYIKKVKNLN